MTEIKDVIDVAKLKVQVISAPIITVNILER